MLPQIAHGYPAAGAPLHGQPGFLPPQDQGSNVPVGIPAGIAAGYGPAAFAGNAAPAGAPVAHVGNAVQGVAHVGNAVPGVAHASVGAAMMGGHVVNVLPQASYGSKPALAGQPQQGNFVQSSGCHEGPGFTRQWQQSRPMSPAPSSFPPGFEPRQNVSVAAGIPSGPHPTPFAQGGIVSHGNQNNFQEAHEYHQRQQQQQQRQGQLEFRRQGCSASQTFYQQQHQSGQQAPASYPQFQSGPCLAQNQHQQHNVLHQDQYQSRNQHQHQRQQQSSGQQNLQHRRSSRQLHQYEESQCQRSHPHAQFLTQTQPYNPQQSTFHPQLRPQSQPHPSWNQEQPPLQPQQSTFQSGGANGIAIGIPVTPTRSKIDAITAQTAVHSQQIAPTWQQPNHIEKSSLNLQGNVTDNHPAVVIPQKEVYQNRAGESCTTDLCKQTKSMSVPMKESYSKLEGMRSTDSPRFEDTQNKWRSELGTGHPMYPTESSHRNWSTPRQGQTHVRASAGKSSYGTRKNFSSHSNGQLKSPGNQPFLGKRGKFVDDQRGLQSQKADFRGKPYSKCPVTRSDTQPSRCEPCDRTFTSGEVLAEHLKSHVTCGEEGCFFEATGKIVKEHRVVEHGKVEFQSTSRGRKALALRSMEDKEDIKRWREERKRSYPTSGNILRKAEEKRKREAEGDCFDEDTQKRRQRMVDIIAKQKQLGYQLPEIPSHYFRGQYNRQPKTSRRDDSVGRLTAQQEEKPGTHTLKEDKENADHADGQCKSKEDRNVSIDNQDLGPLVHDQENAKDFPPCRNGHAKKGRHKRDRRKPCQKSPAGPLLWQRSSPSLLSKLLSKDIESENSCILQCCRFIVNNGFLQGCSLASLKHFKWTEGSLVADGGDPFEANMLDPKASLKSDSKVEAMSPLDSNSSASCAEEFHEAPEFQGLKAMITKERMSKGDDPLIIEDVLEEPSRKKEPVDHRFCLGDETELVTGSKVHSQRSQSPIACVTQNCTAGGDSTGDVQTAAEPKTKNLSSQNLEAGKGVSENSGSVVENEDENFQYSNADVTDADSRCCC